MSIPKAILKRWVQLLQAGYHLMPHEVPRIVVRCVGRILAPPDPLRFRVFPDRVPGGKKKGTNYVLLLRGNTAKPIHARTPYQIEHDTFNKITEMVGGGDVVVSVLASNLLKERVAQIARRHLNGHAFRQSPGLGINLLDKDRHTEFLTSLADKVFIAVRLLTAKSKIDMRYSYPETRRPEKMKHDH